MSTHTHFANNEDVGEPGGKAVAISVLHVNHVKRPGVSLAVGDHPNTAQVGTAGHHAQVTWGEEDGRDENWHKVPR